MDHKDIVLKIVHISRKDLIQLFIDRVEIIVKSNKGTKISLIRVSEHYIHTYEGPFHRHVFETYISLKKQENILAHVDIESDDGRTYHGTITIN